MNESDGLGVEGLSGAGREAVVDKLAVFAEDGAFDDLVATIGIVVKEGVADMLHMDPDLVGASGFENALYQGHIAETFQYFIVGDRFLPVLSLGIGIEQFPEALVPAYVCHDGAGVFCKVSPCQGDILAADSMVEELFCEAADGFLGLCEDHQSAGIFVDPVDQPPTG